MGRSTFSGPIRVGNGDSGVGSVPANMMFDSGNLAGKGVGNYDVLVGKIPPGNIIDIWVDPITAVATATLNVSVGTTSGGADLMAAVAVAAARVRNPATPTSAQLLAWERAADTPIYVRTALTVAGATAGRFIVHVQFIPR